MPKAITLEELRPGETARVMGVAAAGAMQNHLLDLGFVKGSRVTCLFPSALGDPRAYWVRGAVIALRKSDAASVQCRLEVVE